jgi:DNA-binding beta-propeller fold protein YncE
VFVNIEDKSEVEVIDTKSHLVTATWPLAPCETPTGMAIDTRNQRLFIGCENELMVMMDSGTGKVLSTVPIGKGVDAIAFDQGTALAFSSNGEGTVTIVQETAPGKLSVAQTLKTQKGARTMALDPQTHRIYLPAAEFEKAPAAPGKRPAMIPGSLKLLVYGPST